MDCTTCKEIRKQQEATISRYAFESAMTAFERTIKRLWIALIIVILLLACTNAAWIYYESQFAEDKWVYEANTDGGGNAVANGDGDVRIIYGDGESDTYAETP